jgi:hypothetical protein
VRAELDYMCSCAPFAKTNLAGRRQFQSLYCSGRVSKIAIKNPQNHAGEFKGFLIKVCLTKLIITEAIG